MKKYFLTLTKIYLLVTGLYLTHTFAQSNQEAVLETEYNNSGLLFSIVPNPSWAGTTNEALPSKLAGIYGVPADFQLKVTSVTNEEKYVFTRLIQVINGVEVDGGELIVKRNRQGAIQVIIGTLRKASTQGKPEISEVEALRRALTARNVSEKNYRTDINGNLMMPIAKLKYASPDGKETVEKVLCYEFEIHTTQPARWFVYVNAISGKIEFSENALLHVSGTGATLYNGNKNITVSRMATGNHLLVDSARKIKTWNWNNGLDPAKTYLYRDPGSTFDSTIQKPGVSAHWGITQTYDYYLNTHGRKSFDGAGAWIENNVRYDVNLNNAFWDGSRMFYGKGDNAQFSDVVSVDVVGHEFSHAVIERTAGLRYRMESGALNESYADIFGSSIEAYSGDDDWMIAEDCYTPGTGGDALRTMSNPKNEGNPDTYDGPSWNDLTSVTPECDDNLPTYNDCGYVHSNSGVNNFWFYLVSVGKNGTNEKGKNYSVSGIGRNKAEKIAYRALSMYMAPYSDYKAARKATLLAAEDLYGSKTSNEYKQVCNAWYAVNVGEKCCDTMELEFNVTDATCPDASDGEIDLTVKKAVGPFTFRWFKGDTTSSELSTDEDLFALDTGKYIVIVKDTVAKCEMVDKTEVKSPDPIKVSISGAGVFVVPCERSFEVTLTASASGGTPPYKYSWLNGIQKITLSGPFGFSQLYTVTVIDDNLCQTDQSALVTYVPIICSYDPNEIVGPPSYGDQNWVSSKAILPYKIRFENDPKFATGPAQKVTIDHKLDTNTDINSFRLGSFGFYKYAFNVPNNTSSYSTRLDLRDSFGIYLDVVAGVDVVNRKAFWVFESIDPATGLPPTGGNVGFLGVNDSITHKGEGFVNYTIRARKKAVTGDSIRAKAIIVFDANPDVPTPTIFNLIDAVAPTSAIESMPSLVDSVNVLLNISGADDAGGSGLATFDIYVSENNGPYSLHAEDISDTTYRLKGKFGSSYRVYSLSSDNTGNPESAKKNPDVAFTIASAEFFKPIAPNTSLCEGDTLNIEWYPSSYASLDLEYSADSGQTYQTLATGLHGQDTLYRWIIPGTLPGSGNYLIQAVTGVTVIDTTEFVQLNLAPGISLGPDTSFCENTGFNLVLSPGGGYSGYLWSDNSTNQTLNVSTYGTYSVTVTNTHGCSASDQIIVSQDNLPQVSYKTVVHPDCFGDLTGSIDLTVVSGSAPYSYLWNNAQTQQDLVQIGAGTYHVTITDSKGCVATDSTDIVQPSAPLGITYSKLHVECYGDASGSIDISVSGGTPGFTYAWSASNGGIVPSGQSGSEDLSGLVPGTYHVTVTDTNGCQVSESITITQPSAPLSSSFTQQDVNCYAQGTGSVNLSVAGGTSGYEYNWSARNGGVVPFGQSTSEDLNNLVAGDYLVEIHDANGCILLDTVKITQPSSALQSGKSVTHVACYADSSGTIDLSVSGGTPNYTYSWTTSGGTIPAGQSGSQDLSGLTSGDYYVEVTDANGCKQFDTAQITQPSAALSLSATQSNVACYGNATGSVDLTVSGGTPGYSYVWTASNGGMVPSGQSGNQDLSNLKAGDYEVTVTDGNGCEKILQVTITQPSSGLANSYMQLNVTCNGGATGSIDLSVSGGTPPYNYNWTASSGGSIPSGQSDDQDLSGLTAGVYEVTIGDSTGGCTSSAQVTITQPNTLTLSASLTQILCYGNSTGAIDLSVSGGTQPYTYAWSVITGGPVPSGQSSGQDISQAAAGEYVVTVNDSNLCSLTDTFTLTQPVGSPTLSLSVQNVKCFGAATGSINLTPSGGTPGYSFSWTGQNGGNVPSGQQNAEDLSQLTAGSYKVIMTDANGCPVSDSTLVYQPASAPGSTLSQVNVKCYGDSTGSIDLSPSGGTPPYTYSWSAGSGGAVPSGQTGNQDLSGVPVGTYNVTVTDSNGCTHFNNASITQPGSALNTSITHVNTTPGGSSGSIDLSVNGGTSGYTYAWSASNGGAVPSGQGGNQDLSGLITGTYTVLVTDNNGCTRTDSATITANNCGAGNPSGANVYNGNITIKTQTQMNAFYSTTSGPNYGNKWSKVNGNLTIDGGSATDPITDLCNLNALTEVTGHLLIQQFERNGNPGNLSNLVNLSKVGRLTIITNPKFTEISLPGLVQVNQSLYIRGNSRAKTISVPNLSSLGSASPNDNWLHVARNYKAETIEVGNNATTSPLMRLANVLVQNNGDSASNALTMDFNRIRTVTKTLTFGNNKNSGVSNFDNIFSGLDTVGGNMVITYNSYLAKCCIAATTVVQGSRTITGNTGNCADIPAVIADCGSLSKKDSRTGLNEASDYVYFNAYPSPNSGKFAIELNSLETGLAQVTVLDVMGRKVFVHNEEITGYLWVPVDLENYAEGQYMVKIDINKKVFVKKIMVNK